MKAAVVGEAGLEIRDVPAPKPKPNEVLVKVRAIGLNRAELPGAYGSGHTRVTGSIPSRAEYQAVAPARSATK